MPLAASGEMSIGGSTANRSINLEFGRTATQQTSMSQLYRGGGIVTSNNTNVPASGAISLSNFYNATNQFTYTISTNQTNLNLRNGAIAAGWNQSTQLLVVIASGVYVSSNSTGTPGLTVSGSFPGGVSLTNNGFIVGMGGAGGNGCNVFLSNTGSGTAGSAGGLALSVSSAISITNNGTIGGGGGGGGGGQGRFASDESTTRRAGEAVAAAADRLLPILLVAREVRPPVLPASTATPAHLPPLAQVALVDSSFLRQVLPLGRVATVAAGVRQAVPAQTEHRVR